MQRRGLLWGGVGALAVSRLSAAPEPAPESSAWPPDEVIPLWPGEPPGAAGYAPHVLPPDWSAAYVRNVGMPTLNVFRPERPSGRALLVIPGGAYEFVAVINEGVDIGRRFNTNGVTVFVLVYRLPGEGWAARSDVPLQDAQRAMRVIRHKAEARGLNAVQLGVLGFSAGGHLAATLATSHRQQVYAPVDEADALSARPAYAGLIYPVTTMAAPLTHALSRQLLLGPAPSRALVERRSPLRHVGADTPPCFLAHAIDDEAVPVDNSVLFLAALRAAHRPAEAHFFEIGRHAFGIGRPGTPSEFWPALFQLWSDSQLQATHVG